MGFGRRAESKRTPNILETLLVGFLVFPLPILSLLLAVSVNQYSDYFARKTQSAFALVYLSPVILFLAILWLFGVAIAMRRWKEREDPVSLGLVIGSLGVSLLGLMATYGG